jgi:hypothetical protein
MLRSNMSLTGSGRTRRRRRTAVEVDAPEEQFLPGQFDAVGEADVTDVASGLDGADGLTWGQLRQPRKVDGPNATR